MTKEEKVRDYYNQFSTSYDNFYEKIQFQKYEYVSDLMEVGPGTIDLGGGTGTLSKFMNDRILTLDISSEMLKKGIQKENIDDAITADLSALPFRSQSFDLVFSFTAIQNCTSIYNALREIFRVKSKTGKGIITVLEKKITKTVLEKSLNEFPISYQFIRLPIEDIGFFM